MKIDNYNNLEVNLTFKEVITYADWNGRQRSIENKNTINGGNVKIKKV